jgi:hypothetical protein
VLAALVAWMASDLLMPGHPRFCLPLGAAPGWLLVAVCARLVVMGPAWLGWRRAGAFLRPA